MPIVADAQRTTHKTHGAFDIVSPLSMGFPVDVETPERQRFRKEQEERKKHVTADQATSYRPTASGVHSHIIWPHATMKGYLTKHLPPTMLSFVTKHRKRRYVILADRFLYCFKTDTPTHKYRDYMELGPETQVFVTDHLAGVLYCIEIRNPSGDGETTTWYLQADDADAMKVWLERLKKTTQYLADHLGDNNGEPITKDKLHFVHSAEDLFILNGGGIESPYNNDTHSLHGSTSSGSITHHPRSSQQDIDSWRYSDWTDPNSLSSNYASPPLSPTTVTPTTGQSLYQGRSSRHDSIRSSMSNDDHRLRCMIGLPDVLPPQLPPPTSKLPPPPPSYI